MWNKKSVVLLLMTFLVISFFSLSANVFADDEEPAGDESASFISVAPDAMIVLDLSGSMEWNPAGGDYKYGSSSSCVADTTNCVSSGGGGGWGGWGSHPDPWNPWDPGGGGTTGTCSGGFCESAITNCSVNCTRLAIAKRALFNVLDNDDNNVINSADSDSLGIRIGYMRFYNCGGDDSGGSYSSGCNKLVTTISTLGSETGTSYSKTYCGSSTSCASTVSSCSTGSCIIGESATGGTPLATALTEAKSYLDAHKASDASKACRQKFVILVTDGADTYACSGDGSECQSHMYKRRRAVVAAARALYNAGYKVFVIGFGSSMPSYLKNTLNWMAYYGGTDNPYLSNSGSTSAYSIPSGSTYPSGISSCQADTYTESATCYSEGSGSSKSNFKATYDDPGYLDLSGYAFLAGDADELTDAMKNAMNTIRSATYSFTQSSIQAVRTIDENYVYEASFEPLNSDPFWIGNLKRFPINSDGTITAAADWNAGTILQSSTSRNIRIIDTSVSTGVLKKFEDSAITMAMLDVTTEAERTEIINFILNGELDSAYSYYGWKLGDIFHTSPLSIATPNANFYDQWDNTVYDQYYVPATSTVAPHCEPCSGCSKSFTNFLCDNIRTVNGGGRIVIVGANDGQMHSFRAKDGVELWSFIPPNLMPQLKKIVHSVHPTALAHEYFVDGPLSAAEVWLGTGTIGSTSKIKDNWRTYLVMGEGRGGINTLWSTSPNCNSNFSSAYKNYSGTLFVPYGHYCGYYAFDISNTSADPVFKWRLGGSSAISSTSDGTAVYLGQAWSKMHMGRIRLNNTEKWVGFIGAGYSGTNCSGTSTCDTRGKGFFVVDLNNGTILWTNTHADNATMDFDLAAGPTVVDYDGDGFLDTAYVGDLGGNIWRFKFCLARDGTSCGISSWSGSRLFANSSTTDGNKAIYTIPSVTFDQNYDLWVYVGTGNKTDPSGTGSAGRILAVKDSDRSTTYTSSTLTGNNGWYYNLTGTGEKILSEAVVYDKKVYFTSYIPASSSASCGVAGTAKIYILDYLTGSVLYSATIGTGIPSAPVISINPTTKAKDVFVSFSEEASSTTKVHTVLITDPTPDYTPPKTLRYWKDLRVQ